MAEAKVSVKFDTMTLEMSFDATREGAQAFWDGVIALFANGVKAGQLHAPLATMRPSHVTSDDSQSVTFPW